MGTKDLLLADLKQFGEAMLKNEEIGERRFNFFLTLVTSVIAGLVVLQTEKIRIPATDVQTIVHVAVALLLVFGIFTYLRLLQRNRVTDQYKDTLDYIRSRLASEFHTNTAYEVPRPMDAGWRARFKGGLAETVGVMNAILLGSFLVLSSLGYIPSALIAVAVLIGSWHVANRRGVAGAPSQYFRAGVGAVILNKEGNVLAIERADTKGAWQLPQGGLEDSEEPIPAAYREVSDVGL